MTDYTAVLTALYPDAEWTLSGDDYAGLTWLSDTPKPNKKKLDDAWTQVDLDRRWAAVRLERDRLLAASDWTMMADAPLSDMDRSTAAAYRQQLRDVPQDNDDPNSITWPTAPWSAA